MPTNWEWISDPADCAPEEAGYDPSRLVLLESLLRKAVEQGKMQCASYALSRHGKVFASRSFGPGRHDRNLPMRDTFFAPGDRPEENFSLVSDAEAQMLAIRRNAPDRAGLPGGGAFSTCPELLKRGRFFLDGGMACGKRLLAGRTVEAMRTVQVQVPAFHWGDRFEDWRYGLGLEPARHPLIAPGTVWGHEGAGRCAWWFSPADSFVAAWTLPTTLDWDPVFSWAPRALILSGLL